MFDFFKKKEPSAKKVALASPPVSAEVEAAKWAALKAAIEKQKATDPLIGPKMGAKEVNQRLINGLKNQKGVHIESFLTVLGSLAGFSCQMSLREQARKNNGLESEIVLAVADGADGKKYYFGDELNKPLAEDTYSIWGLAAGAAQQFKARLPDVGDIFKHVAGTVGSAEFGVPRIPDKHQPGDLPINYLKVIWPNIFPVVKRYCDQPAEWPVLFGIAIQESIFTARDVIDPGLAVKIVMECAIPMSKVDLPEFYPVAKDPFPS